MPHLVNNFGHYSLVNLDFLFPFLAFELLLLLSGPYFKPSVLKLYC